MEEFIARENIKRLEAQLLECKDGRQKATIFQLLEEEKQRLHNIRAVHAVAPHGPAARLLERPPS